jgi:hypothetical protein
MIAASDDAQRLAALSDVKAWRKLRAAIAASVSQETYATRKLQEMTHAD